MRPGILLFVLGLFGLAVAGCQSVTTNRNPAVDLNRYQHFFVERPVAENNHLDELIAEELRRLGRDATSGPPTMKPDNTDAIVTYNGRWTEDFKKYMIDLHIDVKDARTDKPLTTGRYYQPSLFTKAPAEMIHEVLAPLFGPSAAAGSAKK